MRRAGRRRSLRGRTVLPGRDGRRLRTRGRRSCGAARRGALRAFKGRYRPVGVKSGPARVAEYPLSAVVHWDRILVTGTYRLLAFFAVHVNLRCRYVALECRIISILIRCPAFSISNSAKRLFAFPRRYFVLDDQVTRACVQIAVRRNGYAERFRMAGRRGRPFEFRFPFRFREVRP